MISYIKGELADIFEGGIVVEANGVGYGIFISGRAASLLPPLGNEVKIHTYLNVREDAMQLFGFLTRDDLEKANAYERSINQQHRVLSERVHKRLGEGSSDIQTELIMLEVERNLEHIGDYLINIAEAFQNDKRHTPVLERVAPATM